MAQQQVGTPVGGHLIVDPNLNSVNNEGSSALDASVFNATKDIASMRNALKTINALKSNIYTDTYLDSMVPNDLLFAITSDQELIDAASNIAAWAATTDYVVGNRVTNSTGVLQATTEGTSAGSAPTNPASVGGTVVDGTVTWVRIL